MRDRNLELQARIQGRWNGWIFTPLYLSPLLSFLFSYPWNIEIIFDFPDIITKIHPHFKILDPPLSLHVQSNFYTRAIKDFQMFQEQTNYRNKIFETEQTKQTNESSANWEDKHEVYGKRQKWNFCCLSSSVCTVESKYLYLLWIIRNTSLFLCDLFKDYKKRIENHR